MRIYFLKRAGKNWWGNFPLTHTLEKGDKEICRCDLFFFRKKDAELYRQQYDGEYGNPFVVWSAEVKEDKHDNRKSY
jgi:hypothetical protein